MARLAGKRAIITGAANGIGRASADLFAQEGARVALFDIDAERGGAAAAAIREAGGDARFRQVDVTDEASMREAFAAVAEEFGGLDVLYNNAGGSTPADGPVTTVPLDEFWRTIKVDLLGCFLGCRFGLPIMADSGGGSVINATSIRALYGTPGADAYTAAKGGVRALTPALALQWADKNIRINAIAPGVVASERVIRMGGADERNPINAKNLTRIGRPEDIALLALYLASDESSTVSGAIFPCDSGASAV